jgi:Cupin domain
VRLLAVAVVALAVGAALGVTGDRVLADDEGSGPVLQGGGTLQALPDAPVEVRGESVFLPAGFRSRHIHGGPTFNAVRTGTVEIEDESRKEVYGPGDFFFEPADSPHSIHVLADARLDVVRLLPPGAAATTEVP